MPIATSDTVQSSTLAIRHVVLLVYGIRDQGKWQQDAAEALQKCDGLLALPVKYDFFDAISFISPFGLKSAPYDALLEAYSTVQQQYPTAKVSIIAHSFGTYLVGCLLSDNPNARFHRIVLCGSVLPRNYKWSEVEDKISRRANGKLGVLNECGNKDFWPIVAKSANSRYGDAGRHGFESMVSVDSIWFNGGHSCFFRKRHYEKTWVPFITGPDDASLPKGDASQPESTFYEGIRATFAGIWMVWYFPILVLVLVRTFFIPALILALVAAACYWCIRNASSLRQGESVVTEESSPVPVSLLPDPKTEADFPSPSVVAASSRHPLENVLFLYQNDTKRNLRLLLYDCAAHYRPAPKESDEFSRSCFRDWPFLPTESRGSGERFSKFPTDSNWFGLYAYDIQMRRSYLIGFYDLTQSRRWTFSVFERDGTITGEMSNE